MWASEEESYKMIIASLTSGSVEKCDKRCEPMGMLAKWKIKGGPGREHELDI